MAAKTPRMSGLNGIRAWEVAIGPGCLAEASGEWADSGIHAGTMPRLGWSDQAKPYVR